MSLPEVSISGNNRNKIPGLNSLRFLAFLMVFLFHTTSTFFFGFLGVDFFFVLSSFLLTYLALTEIEHTGGFSQRNFFIRRVLRIFPLYFLIIIFSFLILPWLTTKFGVRVTLPENRLMYWTFLSNYEFSNTILPLKFLWSIAVEEQFYLLFLVFSFFFRKHFKWVLILFFLAYYIYVFLAHQFAWNNNDALGAHLIKFCVGMAAGWLFYRYTLKFKYIFLAFLLTSIALFSARYEQVFFSSILSLWFGLLIFVSIYLGRFIKKTKAFSFTEYLGNFTYGLYIYSGFIIIFGKRFFPQLNRFVLIFAELILVFCVAFASYHLFEKHFLKLKRSFRKKG